MRSNPKERDSREVRRAQGTADDKRDSHPHQGFLPKGLHLRLHWQYIFRLQFKARGPNFHAELIPVHSPLLRESCLVSYPPLTYMLKLSGFAGLSSCLGEVRKRMHTSHKRGSFQGRNNHFSSRTEQPFLIIQQNHTTEQERAQYSACVKRTRQKLLDTQTCASLTYWQQIE